MVPANAASIFRYAKLRNEIRTDFVVDSEIIKKQREVSYTDMWLLAYSNKWHHIQFDDLSILQFQMAPNPSFHFIECPLDVPSMSDFLKQSGRDYRERYDSVVIGEYEDVLLTSDLKKHVTPMRYDYDPKGYNEGVHPVGHIHIGLDNEIRLRVGKEMNPLAFLLFVIRHRYPRNWEFLIKSSFHNRIEAFVRHSLVSIGPGYCKPLDKLEMELI